MPYWGRRGRQWRRAKDRGQAVSFLLIAFVVFMMVRAYNRVTKQAEEEDDGPSEVDLLTEIRDNLSARG